MKRIKLSSSLIKILLQELTSPLDEITSDYKPIRNSVEEIDVFKNILSEICKDELEELEKAQIRVDNAQKKRHDLLEKYPELARLELHLLVGSYSLIKEQDSINKWRRYWTRLNPEYKQIKRLTGFSEIEIESARAYPIENLLDTDFKSAGSGKLRALCPIHDERSPSFIIYTNENKAHCFGCQAHFNNAIDFLMLKESLDFKGAVGRLL